MKVRRAVKKIIAELDVLRFPTPSESPGGATCLNCSSPLSLSQPDEGSPERLLGVCDRCKRWYLVDLIIDQDEGIISGLPDTQVIRELSREDAAGGISVMNRDPGGESPPPPGPTEVPEDTR